MTEKEKTTPIVSVGADTEQSLNVCNNSITDFNEGGKSLDDYLEEMQKEFLQQLDPSHLKTISMRELYNTVYQKERTKNICLFLIIKSKKEQQNLNNWVLKSKKSKPNLMCYPSEC